MCHAGVAIPIKEVAFEFFEFSIRRRSLIAI